MGTCSPIKNKVIINIYFSHDTIFYTYPKGYSLKRTSNLKLSQDIIDTQREIILEYGCEVAVKHISQLPKSYIKKLENLEFLF